MRRHFAKLAMLLLILAVLPVEAQDDYGRFSAPDSQQPAAPPPSADQGQPDQNQPAPGMARLSYVQGNVSIQRGDNGSWEAATLNNPVAINDRISTAANSRAELQLDATDILRLSDSATAKVANLTRSDVQVQIGQGLVTYTVLRGNQANADIDTPNASLHPEGPGEYRIQVNSDSETVITIRSGSAEVSTPQGSTRVQQGQMITIQGTDNPQYKVDSAPARDSWDAFNEDRDRRIQNAQSWHETNPNYTGTEDLDGHGTWSEVPDYGPVWTPSVDDGWAPYRDGRWVWEPYYGWTWVGYEPWGWAPYHYGRWFVYGGRWAWWPGPVAAYPGYYPVWSPAYVSFFGWGGGVGIGVGFGFGGIGWFPVGPSDWYHPWWGGWGRGFAAVGFNEINARHDGFAPLAGERGFGGQRFSNVDGIMHDDRLRAGISSMSSHDFGRLAVPRNQTQFSAGSLRQTSGFTGRMGLQPSRDSFSASGRTANPASFRSAPSASQHFFSAARSNAGFNGNRGFSGGSRPGSFERPGANGGSVQSSRPGWRTFTPPSGNSNRGSFGSGNNGGFYNSRGEYEQEGHSSNPSFNNRGANEGQRSFGSPQASRGGFSNSYSRSPLNMRQPIVTPRGGSSYGNTRGSSAPRGNYSAPRGGNSGGFHAPSGGGSRGGGGHSGGGGHHR